MRSGDFSGLPAIYDPGTAAGGQRQPFPNNRIPTAAWTRWPPLCSPGYPHPNLPGIAQNLRATGDQRINGNQSQRASRSSVFSEGRQLTFELRFSMHAKVDPFGSGVLQESLLPGFGRNLSTHAINGVAGWTHAFTANLLNEARFGFLTVAGGQTSPNAGNPFARQTGLQGVTTNPLDMGYPQVSFGGQFTTMGDPALFTFRNNRDFEFYDNVTWHGGSAHHQVRRVRHALQISSP